MTGRGWAVVVEPALWIVGAPRGRSSLPFPSLPFRVRFRTSSPVALVSSRAEAEAFALYQLFSSPAELPAAASTESSVVFLFFSF